MKKKRTEKELKFLVRTHEHRDTVRKYLNKIITGLIKRGEVHDDSKLKGKELKEFAKHFEKGHELEFGTPAYKEFQKQIMSTLKLHRSRNRHHPEYHDESVPQLGFREMTLLDINEMFCDWIAAAEREGNDPVESVKRCNRIYNIDPDLRHVLINTARLFTKKGKK